MYNWFQRQPIALRILSYFEFKYFSCAGDMSKTKRVLTSLKLPLNWVHKLLKGHNLFKYSTYSEAFKVIKDTDSQTSTSGPFKWRYFEQHAS